VTSEQAALSRPTEPASGSIGSWRPQTDSSAYPGGYGSSSSQQPAHQFEQGSSSSEHSDDSDQEASQPPGSRLDQGKARASDPPEKSEGTKKIGSFTLDQLGKAFIGKGLTDSQRDAIKVYGGFTDADINYLYTLTDRLRGGDGSQRKVVKNTIWHYKQGGSNIVGRSTEQLRQDKQNDKERMNRFQPWNQGSSWQS
jgi:hypothetical protein